MNYSWKHSKGTTSKYHAKHVMIDGHNFDSIRESKRYQELKLMQQAGEIQSLRLQEPYVLIEKSKYGRAIKYYADFVYRQNGETVVEDCKGYKTDVYRLKKRLMAEIYGIEVKET